MSAQDAKNFFDKLEAAAKHPNDPLTLRVNKKLEDIAKAENNPATEQELQDELANRWKADPSYIKFGYSEPPGF